VSDVKENLEDWMVRVTYAEAGDPEAGFEATGEKLDKKVRIALDRLVLVRTEAEAEGEAETETESPPAAEDTPKPREPGDALRVMIVDDEPIVGKRLKPALSKIGVEVEYFQDPKEALARLGEQSFDVVVTDMQMEEVNGLQILEHVMKTAPATRVVLITGYGSVEVARAALSKGAFDFISKPFRPSALRSVVNKAALSLGFEPVDE
jgi:CheY-like chemotaxis protein